MATITVRGRGIVSVQPDEVSVGLTVEALRPSAAEAFAEATRLAEAVVALCDELEIPAGARSTSRVSLAEHGEHTNAGWQHRGYRATSRLAVRDDDAERASSGMPLEAGEHELVAEIDVAFHWCTAYMRGCDTGGTEPGSATETSAPTRPPSASAYSCAFAQG